MQTVFIFDTKRGKRRWILACCTIFDSSAMCTMIFYNVWEVNLITLDDMFWILMVVGGVLFGALFIFWVGIKKVSLTSDDVVRVTENDPLLQNPCGNSEEDPLNTVIDVQEERGMSLLEVFSGYKFYFFIVLSGVNIYRIRYFLGLADYTLVALHDNGLYLQLLGYCFALSLVFAPVVERVVCYLDNQLLSLHVVNVTVTAFFFTWLIPNLPVQVVTFALFILARLFCFSVLTEYCSFTFTQKRFGLVMGSGFVAASIPGAFTYKIVDVVLRRYGGNFWIFHLMCICLSIPTMVLICLVQKMTKKKGESPKAWKYSFDNKSMTCSTSGQRSVSSVLAPRC